jgi:hypothetical protein
MEVDGGREENNSWSGMKGKGEKNWGNGGSEVNNGWSGRKGREEESWEKLRKMEA